jgi:DNA-binding YbaB/EbfC family protein
MGGFDMRQLQQMMVQARQQYEELQRKLESTVVEAGAGGGSVTVKMNGKKQLLAVKIDPEAAGAGDVEMLQDLVMAAVNEASRRVDEQVQASVGGLLGGMGIPGL